MKNIRALVDTKLVERLNHVDNLTKIIFKAVGLEPQKHLLWVVRERRTLTILTQDSILATRIRLEQKSIIQYLRAHSDLLIDTIQVRMTMPKSARMEKRRETYTLTKSNAQTISSIAEGIEDKELRESLLRIAAQSNSKKY